MNARTLALASLLPMLLAAPAAVRAETAAATPADKPLSGTRCLDPRQARSWVRLDNRNLLVDAGRYQYRIQVSSACTALGWTQFLRFRGDGISGRVCGTFDDAILTSDYPCLIDRMSLISKDEYRQLIKDRDAARKARKDARAAAKSGTP